MTAAATTYLSRTALLSAAIFWRRHGKLTSLRRVQRKLASLR